MRLPFRALPSAIVFVALSFTLILPARAQYSVEKLVFTGAAPYIDAELAATAGLASGQMMAQDSLATAAQHLLDTGLFDDAQVSLSGAGKARTVNFALKPIPLAKLLPVSLENFVWLTPAELAEALHARVPLYRGVASDAGNFPDTIQAALQQILAEKGVTAEVSHRLVEPSNEHPVRVVDFRAETPAVVLASGNVTGIPAEVKPEFFRYASRAIGSRYNEGMAGLTIEDRLLFPMRHAGYAAATLTEVQRTFAPAPRGVGVTYNAKMVPGDVYKVSAIGWTASPLYSDADFARDNKLHPGDVAALDELAVLEGKIVAACHAKGYVDAYVTSSPTLDATAHTAGYALRLVPGEVYHLRSVTPTGLSGAALADFEHGWTMKPGDVYNESYVPSFLHNNTALQNLNGYSASFEASADPQTRLVDLTVHFVKMGAGK